MKIADDDKEKGGEKAKIKWNLQLCKMLSSNLFYQKKKDKNNKNREQTKYHKHHLEDMFEIQ